jgi:hypothetical protein
MSVRRIPFRQSCFFTLLLLCLPAAAAADEQYLHAADAVSIGGTSTFGGLDGQQYWQSQTSSAQLLFPLSLHNGDTITEIDVFVENTVSASQTVALRRKSMASTASTLVGTVATPAATGNHTAEIVGISEPISGDNQWYIRIAMGTTPGNRVRGARVTYTPAAEVAK